MSKIFYDRLIILEEVEGEIKNITETKEERDELWSLVDEMVHNKVFDTILGKLPQAHHEEFLNKFHKAPHDESLIVYLKEKIGENVEELIKQEIGTLAFDLLADLKSKKKK
ncbi:hypothetical protein HY502_01650 [Candidatus Woesebacteria bacterium]|nr:hypothetical protein [Candidatus Woesebacteria bacterium]